MRIRSKLKIIFYALVTVVVLLGSGMLLSHQYKQYKDYQSKELKEAILKGYNIGIQEGFQKGSQNTQIEIIKYLYVSCKKYKKFYLPIPTKKGVIQQGYSCNNIKETI